MRVSYSGISGIAEIWLTRLLRIRNGDSWILRKGNDLFWQVFRTNHRTDLLVVQTRCPSGDFVPDLAE
jgi:hypothetical protein